jgi:hypothetical protein
MASPDGAASKGSSRGVMASERGEYQSGATLPETSIGGCRESLASPFQLRPGALAVYIKIDPETRSCTREASSASCITDRTPNP